VIGRATVIIALLFGAPAAAQHGRLFPPRDLGLLESPDREAWQRPDQIMDKLSIADGSVVADLGAGGGWFTVRLARRVGPNGKVYAEDIQPQMIEATKRRVDREQLRNVVMTLGNASDPKLPEAALDAVLMVDAYNEVEHPVVLLRNIARSLKPNGRVGVVEWTPEGGGPGPDLNQRIDPEQVVRDVEAAGLRVISREDFLRYQYMLILGKPEAASR
jgi:ubiquinone/menaquinone biosynthesis C-methylase UbiE